MVLLCVLYLCHVHNLDHDSQGLLRHHNPGRFLIGIVCINIVKIPNDFSIFFKKHKCTYQCLKNDVT